MNELNVALCILACKEEPESTWFNNKFKECEKTKHRCVRYERIEGALKHTELVTAEKIFGELERVMGVIDRQINSYKDNNPLWINKVTVLEDIKDNLKAELDGEQ